MKSVALGLSCALLAGAATSTPPPLPLPRGCEAQLGGYGQTLTSPWTLDLRAPGGGALFYVGVQHSRDPDDEQFEYLERSFAEVKPTVAFYEGPDRGVGADGPDTIRSRGESGYIRWLAKQAGVAAQPLEDPNAEFAAMAEQFPLDQVALFYILRQAQQWRDREDLTGAKLDARVADLITRSGKLMQTQGRTPPFTDIAGLDAAYRKYWRTPADWREAPARWFDPRARDTDTGGVFTNSINAASSSWRNRHMARLLANRAAAGDRVYAAVGRDHIPRQAPALRCSLSPKQARMKSTAGR